MWKDNDSTLMLVLMVMASTGKKDQKGAALPSSNLATDVFKMRQFGWRTDPRTPRRDRSKDRSSQRDLERQVA